MGECVLVVFTISVVTGLKATEIFLDQYGKAA
jgi:hypothetical protein